MSHILKAHVPVKYHSYLSSTPKVTKVKDLGIVAYHGEPDVEQITYEYGSVKPSANTIILPALINKNENGKLSQISVIIHWGT